MPARFELIAPCFFGCESTAKFELTRIGAENIRVEDGRLSFAGGAEMIAPHSIDRRFGAGRPDESDTAKLMEFLHKLEAKEKLGVVAMPGSHDYRRYDGLPLHPVSGRDCSGCGTCAQECPTGAIDGGDPRKPDPAKCISCMRCVSVCPFEVRHVPKALLLAASASLRLVCSTRKEPKFYI